MDQRVFLRDIDDWELYGKGLHAHIGSWVDQLELLNKLLHKDGSKARLHEEMTGLYGDMRGVLACAAERLSRLADKRVQISRKPDRLTKHKLHPDET